MLYFNLMEDHLESLFVRTMKKGMRVFDLGFWLNKARLNETKDLAFVQTTVLVINDGVVVKVDKSR